MSQVNKQKVPKIRFEGFYEDLVSMEFREFTKLSQGLQISIDKRFLEPREGRVFYITNEFLNPNSEKKFYIENPPKSVIANEEDILMTRTGNTGKVVTNVSGAYHNNFFKINYDKTVDKDYLYYLLNKPRIQSEILARAGSSTIPDLNHSDFYSLKSMYPVKKEQTQIGNLFKQLDKLIELQTRAVESAETYKKAMLQKIFPQQGGKVPRVRFEGFGENWIKEKLEKIAEFRRGSFPQPYGLSKWYSDDGMPFVQVYDVGENMLLKENTKQKISVLAQKQSVFVPKGTLILTIQGSIGRIAKTQYDSYVDRTLLIFEKISSKIDIDYFKYVVFLLFEIEKQRAPGGTIKTITKKVLSDFMVTFPSLKEQKKIGNFFQKLDQNIEAEKQKLAKYQDMKKAMLQRMFV